MATSRKRHEARSGSHIAVDYQLDRVGGAPGIEVLPFGPAKEGRPGQHGGGVGAEGQAKGSPMRRRAGSKQAPTKTSLSGFAAVFDCSGSHER